MLELVVLMLEFSIFALSSSGSIKALADNHVVYHKMEKRRWLSAISFVDQELFPSLRISHQIDWLVDWLTDWLVDWSIVWLVEWLTDWLTDWLASWLIIWVTD